MGEGYEQIIHRRRKARTYIKHHKNMFQFTINQ